jgi:hypothetical protein
MPIGQGMGREGSPLECFSVVASERPETDVFPSRQPLAGIVEVAFGLPRSALGNLALLYEGVRRQPMRT